jgi:lipopolysaccharide heptosyltransferase II
VTVDLNEGAQQFGRPLRVLVTRLRYLGDVIITTPAVAALKARYPEAELYYLTEEAFAPVLEGNPHLTGIIPLRRGVIEGARTMRTIRRLRFTAAADLFYNPRSAFLLFVSGIPIRAGGSRRWRRHLYTVTFTVPGGIRSAVEHHVAALRVFDVPHSVGLPRIFLDEEELSSGAALLAERTGGRAGGVVAIHPGGTWQSKRWEPGSWARLAQMLKRRFDTRILIVAGPGEEHIAQAVRERAGDDVFLLPLMPIRSLATVLGNCDAVVSNDGGILHVAVSVGSPTVGIFGPTEPDIWFPYEGTGPFALAARNEDCAPCHRHECETLECLRKLEPEAVLEKVESVLAWNTDNSSPTFPGWGTSNRSLSSG